MIDEKIPLDRLICDIIAGKMETSAKPVPAKEIFEEVHRNTDCDDEDVCAAMRWLETEGMIRQARPSSFVLEDIEALAQKLNLTKLLDSVSVKDKD